MIAIIIFLFVLPFIIGAIAIPHIVNLAMRLHLYDQPNARKVHKKPIPRIGGIIFLPAATIAIAIVIVISTRFLSLDEINDMWADMQTQHLLAYICGVIIIYAIGLYDDIYCANYRIKFIAQIVAASLLCVSGLWIANLSNVFFIGEIPFWIGMPFTVLIVVFVTNAMNLIDGIDGLASGLSIIAMIIIASLNIIAGNMIWAYVAVAYAGVLSIFFYYNVFSWKYKIFMGDAGSLSLGFTLAFLVLHFWQRDPVWNPLFHNVGLVALSPLTIPLLDVIRVFFFRIANKKNPFLPDKNHIHHLLLNAGFSARNTLLLILVFSILIIAGNYIVADFISQTLMIFMDICLYGMMIFTIERMKDNQFDSEKS